MQSINISVTISSVNLCGLEGYFVEDKKKNVIIRVDEELGKQIKIKVATDGTTQQEYIVGLIKADLEKQKEGSNK